MSESGDIHIVSANVGALTNGVRPILKVPTGFGGISILGAQCTQGGTTNSGVQLLRYGSAGTAVTGTITATAIGGTATPFAANTPKAWTIDTPYIPEGDYVVVKETNVEAMNAVAIVSLSYMMGR